MEPLTSPFHSESVDNAASQLESDVRSGLSKAEAAARLRLFGLNELKKTGIRSWLSVLLKQFTDFLILILLLAALVSLVIGQAGDAVTILAVIVINGCLGFVQEWRAEHSLEALQDLLAAKSRVVRDGHEQLIEACELVPGDLVRLEIGDRISADIRLTETVNLRVDESALTGESVPVHKNTAAQPVETGLANRACMAWTGASVVNGYRSAADLILLDDNFRTIVAAVEEGRRQFDNIRKFVRYILSAHLVEVVAIFLNIILGGPLILLPVQILWMNLVTDGMTAIALGLEPGEAGRMTRPPHDPGERLPNRQGIWIILGAGTYIALATVGLFYFNLGEGTPADILRAQTIAFTGIIVLEKVNVFNFRSLDHPVHSIGWLSNKWLLLAIAITLGAHACAVYVPFLQTALHTVPLSWQDWSIMFIVALPLFAIMETAKMISKHLAARKPA